MKVFKRLPGWALLPVYIVGLIAWFVSEIPGIYCCRLGDKIEKYIDRAVEWNDNFLMDKESGV